LRRKRQIASNTADDGQRRFIALCRTLLALIGLLLVVTPWTEGYRLLDNFPRGQDSEVHLLALLAFFGMVLLLARSCNGSVSLALTFALWVRFVWRRVLRIAFGLEQSAPVLARHIPPLPGSLRASFNLPLQI
jgi:hypothetical protein